MSHKAAIELGQRVALLNALIDEETPWVRHRAKKAHVDMFGVTISADREHYFRRVGPSFDHVQRLATDSMACVCAAVLTGSPLLVAEAGQRAEARFAVKVDLVKKLR